MKAALLQTEGLYRSFAGVAALSDVSFRADAAQVHAIAGANGAGKSTLIKILSGALKPSSGRVLLNGETVHFDSPRQAQQHGIVAVYQELSLVPDLSVAQNIFLGREPAGRSGLIDQRRMINDARQLMERIGFDIDPQAEVAALRVADQQLVEITRAISLDSRLVILDEPTAVLSLPEREKLFAIIGRLRSDGIAVLYISHRLDEIFALSQQVSVFRDGRRVSTAATADVSESDIVRQMIGIDVAPVRRRRDGIAPDPSSRKSWESPADSAADAAPLLEVRQNSASGSRTFTVGSGEIVGLAGFVGSGRSRLGRRLAGSAGPAARAPAGSVNQLEIRIDGRKVSPASPAQAAKLGIVYLTEDRKRDGLFNSLDVLANTSAASLDRISRGGVLRSGLERALSTPPLRRMRLKSASLHSGVHELSGGNQQKVIFARGLLQQPRLLICDEPTRGVDVGAKREIHELLIELADQGVAVIVISSEFGELKSLCDRFLVMSGGVVIADLKTDEASEERLLALASGLMAFRTNIPQSTLSGE